MVLCVSTQAQILAPILTEPPTAAAGPITPTNTGNGLCIGANGGTTISLGTTTATGNFIVVAVSHQGAPPTAGPDNFGNTYTAIAATGGVTPPEGLLFYSANAIGGVGHTVPFTGTFAGACAMVLTGLTATPFDKQAHITDHLATTVQGGSVALAGTPSLVVTMLNGGVPTGIDSSFINSGTLALGGGNNYAVALYYKISSITENPTITLSPSASTCAQNAVFK